MTLEKTLRERLKNDQADSTVNFYLYPSNEGGRTRPIGIGYGCPCTTIMDLTEGSDGYLLLDSEMLPGERRQVGFVFLSGRAAADALAASDRFYLWEGRFIGEAGIVR